MARWASGVGRLQPEKSAKRGTPRCFEQRMRKVLRNKEMRFALCKECERARLERGKNKLQHRQSRWLSKERSCGRGKMDRCQNKGDRKSCPDLGAKERGEGESRQEWGRTVRMELDYTRQFSMASFTKSISIC